MLTGHPGNAVAFIGLRKWFGHVIGLSLLSTRIG